MSGAKHHDYHLVNPSVWPLIGSAAALVMFFGLVMFMHADYFGGAGKWVLGLGFMGVIATFFSWWSDVINEAHAGDHTPVVQLHLRYGMILFIASEVMFFVDPKIMDDPDARDVQEITLSYTFHPVDEGKKAS